MSVLLAILSSEKDNLLLQRHWQFFVKTKWSILFCGTEDGKAKCPDSNVPQLNVGKVGTRMTPAGSAIFGLIESELLAWKWFLEHPEYDSVAVVEPDNLFVRTPPEHPGDGLYLVTLLPNYDKKGLFQTPVYFSSPRWGDRKCITQLYHHGVEMFKRGNTEWDMSDRFPALICHKAYIPWMAQPAWSPPAYAYGGTSDEVWVMQARAAIKLGCYALHACKFEWQLDALKDLLPC